MKNMKELKAIEANIERLKTIVNLYKSLNISGNNKGTKKLKEFEKKKGITFNTLIQILETRKKNIESKMNNKSKPKLSKVKKIGNMKRKSKSKKNKSKNKRYLK